MYLFRIDHVVTMENGQPCKPYHATMRVIADDAKQAWEVGRMRDPRLSAGAEVVEIGPSSLAKSWEIGLDVWVA